MTLHLDVALCTRASSKFSECTQCIEAAPKHLKLVENLPTFVRATGVEAAACVGACPTEAFSLSGFSVTEFFFTFLDSKVRLISSRLNLPCLSVLSVEHLLSLALASDEEITLDLEGYEKGSHLFGVIVSRLEEANFILSSFSSKRIVSNHIEAIEVEATKEEPKRTRRDFLRSASLKGVLKQQKAFEEAVEAESLHSYTIDASTIEKLKRKHLPDKRKILLTTLKHTPAPSHFEVLPQEEVGFLSQKFIDEGCTNCQMCYRICPSGALSSNGKFSLIHFDAMLCLKCHLCHEVCEPNAIHLQAGFEIAEFFEPKQRTLATFDVRRCNECGNSFTYTTGEQTCPRCLLEEEEAMFLHNNAKSMRGER